MDDSMSKPKLYYLQNLNAGYVGNSPCFWEINGSGYTPWIDEAKQFTLEEAKLIERSTKGSHRWKRWPVALIESKAKRCVDMQDLPPVMRKRR